MDAVKNNRPHIPTIVAARSECIRGPSSGDGNGSTSLESVADSVYPGMNGYGWERQVVANMRRQRLSGVVDRKISVLSPAGEQSYVNQCSQMTRPTQNDVCTPQDLEFFKRYDGAQAVYDKLVQQTLYAYQRAKYVRLAFENPDLVLSEGSHQAKHVLGIRYLHLFIATGTENHLMMAARCFDEAALAGSAHACIELALLFFTGHLVDEKGQSKTCARELFFHALPSQPNNALIWWQIGETYRQEGKNVLALWFFEQAEWRDSSLKSQVREWLTSILNDVPGAICINPDETTSSKIIQSAKTMALLASKPYLASVPRYIHRYPEMVYREAIKLHREGRCKEALFLFESSTLRNYPEHSGELYQIAQTYLLGKGVAKNLALARRYLLLAARQGCSEAYEPLGTLYAMGDGVHSKDPWAALYWYRKADAQTPGACAQFISQIQKTIPAPDTPELQAAIKRFLLKAHDGRLGSRMMLGQAYLKLNTPDADKIAIPYLQVN